MALYRLPDVPTETYDAWAIERLQRSATGTLEVDLFRSDHADAIGAIPSDAQHPDVLTAQLADEAYRQAAEDDEDARRRDEQARRAEAERQARIEQARTQLADPATAGGGWLQSMTTQLGGLLGSASGGGAEPLVGPDGSSSGGGVEYAGLPDMDAAVEAAYGAEPDLEAEMASGVPETVAALEPVTPTPVTVDEPETPTGRVRRLLGSIMDLLGDDAVAAPVLGPGDGGTAPIGPVAAPQQSQAGILGAGSVQDEQLAAGEAPAPVVEQLASSVTGPAGAAVPGAPYAADVVGELRADRFESSPTVTGRVLETASQVPERVLGPPGSGPFAETVRGVLGIPDVERYDELFRKRLRGETLMPEEERDFEQVRERVTMNTAMGPVGPQRVTGAAARTIRGPVPRQERAAELARPITLTLPEEVARLRLDTFPEEMREELLNAAKGTNFGERLRRGILSDEAVQSLAQEYAPTVDAAIAGSRRGRAYSAEEIVGLRNLLVGQDARIRTLADEATTAKAGGVVDSVLLAQIAVEQKKFALLGDIAFGGAPAEAGRALRAFRAVAQNLEANPGEVGLRYIRQQFGSLEAGEEVVSRYQQMVGDGATPVELATFLRNAKGSWLDRLGILRYSSMLSSTTTQAINASGNVLMQGVDIATKPLMAGLDIGRSAITGRERQVFAAELPAQLHGIYAGAIEGARDAAFTMRHGIRPEEVTKLDYVRQGFGTDIPVLAPAGSKAAGAVNFLMEGPLRSLAAADVFFRSTAQSGHQAALAVAEAMKAGGGRATAEAIGEAMASPKIAEAAEALARRSVLQEPRALTDWFLKSRDLPPAQRAVIEAAVPFVRTPFNLIAQGIGMTPVGVAGLIHAAKAGAPAREIEERVARMALGTAVMGIASWQNIAGNLTGPRPESEAERSTLPPGWQPWSVRHTGPDGVTKYYPMAILGPLAVPAVLGILLSETYRQGTPFDPVAAAWGIGQYAVDQTFFRGVSDFAKAMTEGGSRIENFMESVASQYSPHIIGGGALGRQLQQIMGQPQRDPHGAIEAILATHPATAEMVPPRRDVLGRPQVNAPGGAETALSPVRSSVERDELVIAAFRSAGEGLPMRAPDVVRDPDTGQRVTLTRDQQTAWRTAFGSALQRTWRADGRPSRSQDLRSVEQQARDEATTRVLSGIGSGARRAQTVR